MTPRQKLFMQALVTEKENLIMARAQLCSATRWHELSGTNLHAVVQATAIEHSAYHRWLRASAQFIASR